MGIRTITRFTRFLAAPTALREGTPRRQRSNGLPARTPLRRQNNPVWTPSSAIWSITTGRSAWSSKTDRSSHAGAKEITG
jgi:hypothetical protein